MYTVFVTGPLASGKRSVCQYLTRRGFTHIDLDDMAKEFLFDEEVQRQLVEAYGDTILGNTGTIDRALLAKQAFAGVGSSDTLNGIIWPLVQARLSDVIVGKSCQIDHTEDKLVIEIAMLAEAPEMTDLADTVLCVAADKSIRIERALARGMQLEDVLNRMALQASDEERAQLCDVVIENNGSLEMLHAKIDAWLELQQQEHLF